MTKKHLLKSFIWIILSIIIFGGFGIIPAWIMFYADSVLLKMLGVLGTIFCGTMIIVIVDFQIYKIKRIIYKIKKINEITEIENKIK
jgi:hypothetical protein